MALSPEEQAKLDALIAERSMIDDDEPAPVNPAVLTDEDPDSMLRTAKDMLLGGAQGVTLGGADEGVAALLAARDWLQDKGNTYRQHQIEQEQIYKEASDRSPIAYTGGEIATGLGAGLLTGGAGLAGGLASIGKVGAKEVAKRAAIAAGKGAIAGSVAGGLSSEGSLETPEQAAKLAQDAALGAGLGGAISGGMQTFTDAVKPAISSAVKNYVDDSPLLRQTARAFKEGQEGVEISGGEKAQQILSNRKKDLTEVGVREIKDVEQKLGQNIDSVLDKADKSGATINLSATNKDLVDILNEKMGNPNFRTRIASLNVNPTEVEAILANPMAPSNARKLRNILLNLADTYEPKSDEALQLKSAAIGLKKELDKVVPEFKEASSLFHDYRTMGPETILHEGVPEHYRKDTWMKDLKNKDNSLYKEVNSMYEEMNRGGASAAPAKDTFNTYIDNLNKFKDRYPGKLQQLGIKLDPESMKKSGMERGDIFALSGRINSIDPMSSPKLSSQILAKDTTTSRGLALGGANKAGMVASSKANPFNWYSMGEDKLVQLGEKLRGDPALARHANALQTAIDNKDLGRKNAILFTLAQQPKAREMARELLGINTEE